MDSSSLRVTSIRCSSTTPCVTMPKNHERVCPSSEHEVCSTVRSRCPTAGISPPSNVNPPCRHAFTTSNTTMTPNCSKPMTEAEFETRLHQLITEARNGNVPLAGSYSVCSPEPNIQDYEVLITKLTNQVPAATDTDS